MTDEQVARQELGRGELAKQLRPLGVERGGVLVAHTSFRAVQGGRGDRIRDLPLTKRPFIRPIVLTLPPTNQPIEVGLAGANRPHEHRWVGTPAGHMRDCD